MATSIRCGSGAETLLALSTNKADLLLEETSPTPPLAGNFLARSPRTIVRGRCVTSQLPSYSCNHPQESQLDLHCICRLQPEDPSLFFDEFAELLVAGHVR